MTVTITHETKVRVSAKRMFKALVTESHHLLHKIAPSSIKSVEVLEGDGGCGSVRKIHFPDGAPHTHIKDKLADVDPENLSCKLIILEGAVLGDKLESIESEHKFVDSDDGGSIIKLTVHHHTKPGCEFSEEDIKDGRDGGLRLYKEVEEYLIAHPDVCA